MKTRLSNTALILLCVALIVFVISIPLLTIWALNTLFPVLAIPFTIKTWAASLLLGGVFYRFSVKS